jgi:hypothetical protein
MALWDIQRDSRDGRILCIRPSGYFAARLAESLKDSLTKDKDGKPVSCIADHLPPFVITTEELGPTYFEKDAISAEKGGDGLTKTAKQLAVESTVKAEPVTSIKVLTVEQLDAEIQARGYKPISPASSAEAMGE